MTSIRCAFYLLLAAHLCISCDQYVNTPYVISDTIIVSDIPEEYKDGHGRLDIEKFKQAIWGRSKITRALHELGFDSNLPKNNDGRLTSEGRRSMDEMADNVMNKVALTIQGQSDQSYLIDVQSTYSDRIAGEIIHEKLLEYFCDDYGAIFHIKQGCPVQASP